MGPKTLRVPAEIISGGVLSARSRTETMNLIVRSGAVIPTEGTMGIDSLYYLASKLTCGVGTRAG